MALFFIFIFFMEVTDGQGQGLQAGCSLAGTWNNGNPDSQFNQSKLTNKMVVCNLPKRDKHDITRQDLGLLANSTTGLESITYVFTTGNQRKKVILKKNEIKDFISRHNINFEDLLPDNHPGRRDHYVRLLLKEKKRIDNASSITVDKEGIKLRPGTNLWADNGKGFSRVEVDHNFEFESCLYTGKRRVWYCTEKGCSDKNIFGKEETALKICQAPVSCIGIDGALHPTNATCLAYGEGNCPPPSLCAQDVILKRLNLGTITESHPDSSARDDSRGESR